MRNAEHEPLDWPPRHARRTQQPRMLEGRIRAERVVLGAPKRPIGFAVTL